VSTFANWTDYIHGGIVDGLVRLKLIKVTCYTAPHDNEKLGVVVSLTHCLSLIIFGC